MLEEDGLITGGPTIDAQAAETLEPAEMPEPPETPEPPESQAAPMSGEENPGFSVARPRQWARGKYTGVRHWDYKPKASDQG